MDDKLTTKEKIEIAVQSGLQLVPYVGGALSTLYFGTKQEKRFKRIESFYEEFAAQVEQQGIIIPPIEHHDEEKLTALIEELNEKIEREQSEQKRQYFKQYLLNTLLSPTSNNFDERRFFLDALANMTQLEIEILKFLLEQTEPTIVGALQKEGVDQYAIVGAVGRLKMYGLLSASTRSLTIGEGTDNALNETITLSEFGKKFIQYCLQ